MPVIIPEIKEIISLFGDGDERFFGKIFHLGRDKGLWFTVLINKPKTFVYLTIYKPNKIDKKDRILKRSRNLRFIVGKESDFKPVVNRHGAALLLKSPESLSENLIAF